MTISHNPENLKRFQRMPWKFQATFETPLRQLKSFTTTILSTEEQLASGCVTIDQVVFEPKHMKSLVKTTPGAGDICRDQSLAVEGRERVQELLTAALSDWIDFLFVPLPKSFVIYGDHDEYTTFYATTKSNLNRVVAPLLAGNFTQVLDYKRQF